METDLFNDDYSTVVLWIITSTVALTWLVVGLTIPRRMRSDIKRQLRELLWRQLQDRFNALVCVHPDNAEDLLDAEFRGRAGQLIARAMASTHGKEAAH